MKVIFVILCSFIVLNCKPQRNVESIFNQLKDKDYSVYKGYSITDRNGTYILIKDDDRFFIETSFGKIKSICNTKREKIEMSLDEKKKLENLISSFNELKIDNLSVDESENVQLVFPFGKCSYTFLRLSQGNSLKDLNKSYFEKYKNNWYLYKQCAE